MLTCFENIVGAKTCENGQYKKYIESLNISVKKLAGIANGAQITGAEYLDAKVAESIDLTLINVAQNLAFTTESLANIRYRNTFNDYFAGERGLFYQAKCQYEKLFIDFVMFKGNDTVPGKTLKIVDNATVHTFTFNAVANMVVNIPVNMKFNSQTVEILVDNSDVRTAQNNPFTDECLCTLTGQTYGLSVIGYYACDEELFKCQLSNMGSFQSAILYKTGALILEDLADGTQMNEVIITKPDNLQERADTFHHRAEQFQKSAKMEFDKMIKNSCCYDCKETYIVNYSM
jgi:hypothetical protein